MNKRVRKVAAFLCALFLLVVFMACNIERKLIKEPLKDKGADFLFEQLKKNEFSFNYLNIKFSADITFNKKDNSTNGSLRIIRDSAIWISLSPALGIEAARMLITVDSIKFLNRLESTYFVEDFKYLNSLLKTNLDFDMLQSLLVGNDFSSYENDVFKASIDGKQYLLSTIGRGKLKKYKRILKPAISTVNVGIGYATILALLINFSYKNIILAIVLVTTYMTFLTFAFKTLTKA